MILRNVGRAVVVVVDEELMIFVAYSEDVRIRWCDDKLVALSDSLVMHSSILGHIPDTSGVVSVAKEMLPLEIPYHTARFCASRLICSLVISFPS